MKTEDALALAGSKIQLAKLCRVVRQTIQKWGDEVPLKRERLLRKKKPEWFVGAEPLPPAPKKKKAKSVKPAPQS
jgi:hypothetical protein